MSDKNMKYEVILQSGGGFYKTVAVCKTIEQACEILRRMTCLLLPEQAITNPHSRSSYVVVPREDLELPGFE